MKRGRILALDYGSKNVGLACCDELRITVHPLPSIPNLGKKDLIRRLDSIVSEQGIQELLVGMPYNMDGSSGEAIRRVNDFINLLREKVDLPLQGFDERLSTVDAQETWNSMSPKRQRKYRTIDSLAAACILERFLRES